MSEEKDTEKELSTERRGDFVRKNKLVALLSGVYYVSPVSIILCQTVSVTR